MEKLENIYKKSFFGKRYKLEWRAPILCDAIIHTTGITPPGRIVDVGCATGEFIAEFRKRGYQSYGIEGSENAFKFIPKKIRKFVQLFDLRDNFSELIFSKKFDIAICMEVAEHIEKEYSDIFVDNLCNLSDYVMMSAAPPGQKGHHHVNCQFSEYWEEKFKVYGYKRITDYEIKFETFMYPWIRKKGLNAYCQNTLIFRKK